MAESATAVNGGVRGGGNGCSGSSCTAAMVAAAEAAAQIMEIGELNIMSACDNVISSIIGLNHVTLND